MNKLFTLLLLCAVSTTLRAQTVPQAQAYGKVDQADLEMKECDFEKDANAEVLINKGDVYFSADLLAITNEVHKRIKIFNDNGNKEADIHIPYFTGGHLQFISGLEAETINLVDGKIKITKLDKKQIYTKAIDNWRSEITFTFPNVKPGCIIEYKYEWHSHAFWNIPFWFFQDKIPVRYSEFDTSIPDVFYFRLQPNINREFIKHIHTTEERSMQNASTSYPYTLEDESWGMANVPSLHQEPYMSSFVDNLEAMRFELVSVRPLGPLNGFVITGNNTWAKVGGYLEEFTDFGGQFKRKLNNEEAIINKAKTLKTDDEKIAYIFNEVKNTMKWNGSDSWYTIDGTSRAWENKTGNSAEINLILYHLLKQSGVTSYPMVVSTREHGKVSGYSASTDQFNKAVVFIPVDSTKNYVLDATGKYNLYNEAPEELLNSLALFIDKDNKRYNMVYLHKNMPARQVVLISAEIKADGKLEGTAEINSTSYYKVDAEKRYKTDGEKKYTEYLTDNDNNLKISSIKMANMEADSLPLVQSIGFKLELTGSDEHYIYLNPNLFTSLKINPFLSAKRMTDVDFGYLRDYSINGIYKIPTGYKIDALPKNVMMVMPDGSISFRRMIEEQDGNITVRYSIKYNKAEYSKNEYPEFYEFSKKMYEMLNEQIILKKG